MEDAFRISNKSQKKRNDTSVQGTNDSSVLSKISTCQAGYFDDNYLKFFANKIAKRSSLVNRGYYIRAQLIHFVLDDFLKKATKAPNQILNLGAGFDATYFRLKQQNRLANSLFIEIDFPDVIKRKVHLIKNNENLSSLCPDLKVLNESKENVIYSCQDSKYVLIGIDMRNTRLLEAFLKIVDGFSEEVSTFLLSEVVLTYMAVNSCNSVIQWITETFQNCLLCVYEQINPLDSFGQIMCSHFKKLGSPLKCIQKYPYEAEQIERYKSAGFKDSFSIKASDFYVYNTSEEEKLRVNQLELFDEYEPWHLKCSHYTIISSTRGEFMTNLARDLYQKVNRIPNQIKLEKDLSRVEPLDNDKFIIKLKPFDAVIGVRYGHRLVSVDSKLFIFGGFGEMVNDPSGKHMRHNIIDVVDLKTMETSFINSVQFMDRIFHTCTLLPSNNPNVISILLAYGRSNPSKMFDSITKLNLPINGEGTITQEEVLDTNNEVGFRSRFRHAACMAPDSKLFLYGGKYFNEALSTSHTLNDAYFIETAGNFQIEKINVDENVCIGRHSHCISAWKDFLIISGGLDQNENPLSDIILFDCQNLKMRKLTPANGQVFPRYSHTSHVIEDTLILVGGCNYSDISPGVCFVNLNTLAVYEFNVPSTTFNGEEPLMLIQHQSHVLDKNSILVVGGGAICFTFGTHLNRRPVILDLTECWMKFYSN